MKAKRLIIGLTLLTILLLAIITSGGREYEAKAAEEGPLPQLQVHFINLGYGDTILLDLGDTEVLIDGGYGVPDLTRHLERYIDGSLEAMIATHPHDDHIGGLIAVLDTFDVEQIWHNGDTAKSSTYRGFINKVNAEGAEVKVARRGDAIVVDGLTLNVLHPTEPLVSKKNNNSIVLMLSYGEIDLLFAADAEKEAEAEMIGADVLADVEILKAGHHGLRTSCSKAFLDITWPEVVIYLPSLGNPYGQPHYETLHRCHNIGAKVFGAAKDGMSIMVRTDGETYSVNSVWVK